MAKPDYSKLEGVRVYTPVRISKQGMQNIDAIRSFFVAGVIDLDEMQRRTEREFEMARVEAQVDREYAAQENVFAHPIGRLRASLDDQHTLDWNSIADRVLYLNRRGVTSTDEARKVLDKSMWSIFLPEEQIQEVIDAWARQNSEQLPQYEDALVGYETC